MQLFCLRAAEELVKEYVRESYVSIQLPWLHEDVEFVAWEQLCANYEQARDSEQLRIFVYEMQDEDLILLTDGQSAYLGDLGDYFFVEADKSDDQLPPRLHRRGVTWLKSMAGQLNSLAPQLQHFMNSTELLAKYADEVSLDEMEQLLEYRMHAGLAKQTDRKESADIADYRLADQSNGKSAAVIVDEETIKEAIDILKQALHSEDVERRERAAIALLSYAKN